jgi:hypothetical protein
MIGFKTWDGLEESRLRSGLEYVAIEEHLATQTQVEVVGRRSVVPRG